MPRTLSATAAQAIFSQETSEEFIMLLQITQDELLGDIFLVGYRENITHNSNEYLAAGFKIVLPQERDDRPPEVTLEVDNVDRRIVEGVRVATVAPTITLTVVLLSTPETIEAGPFDFTLRSVEWDSLTVRGRLVYEAILDEPYPAGTFSPTEFPALF